MKRWLGLLLLCGCAARPPAPPPPPQPPPQLAPTTSPIFRLVDHAAEAEVTGDLVGAYANLSHALVSPSPLPNAPDAAFPRALQVAFAEPELTRLLPSAKGAAGPAPKAIDLTWNRTRGVYEAREALFLPGGARYVFTLPPGPSRHLVGELALPPGGPPAKLVIGLDDRSLAPVETTPEDRGRWRRIEIALPATAKDTRLSLAVEARDGTLFLGAPIVRPPGRPTADKRPNIVFILVDTLRADALSAMPRLSAFAEKGARYAQAVSAATWTRPSLIAALGGDLATRLGHSAEDMIPSEREKRRFRALRPQLLPERLAAAGWDTRAIGNNFFLLGFPRIGLDLGLDAVTDVRHPVLDTPAITAEAIRFLEAPHEAPFFLYLHYDAPHWPYTPPPPAAARAKGLGLPGLEGVRDPAIAAYLGEAAYADEALGQLFDALERSGLASSTIVAVLGDHGEIFDPAHAHTVAALALPTLHHHGWSAYDEIDRVPLVLVWPGSIAPRVVETQTSLVDLAPTLAELAGLAMPTDALEPTRGQSMARALRGGGDWPLAPRPAFIEGQNIRALRADGWLYLRRGDPRLRRGNAAVEVSEELYELASDPLQHHDRSGDPAAPLQSMRARFAASAPSLPPFREPVLHLVMAEDAHAHVLRGELRCASGTLAVRAIERGRVVPAVAKNGAALGLELEPGGHLAFVVDPPEAPIELALQRDGIPIDADRLLVGALALPLLGGGTHAATVRVGPDRMGWLDAARAPERGATGDVLLWRDPAGPMDSGSHGASADGEVATMMRRWGYAQPGK